MPAIVRGNTVYFSFVFYDENDDVALIDSAECQLTYAGRDGMETETLTLTQVGDEWRAEWASTKARPGTWVDYHAHALDEGYVRAEDGRFKLSGNAAGLDHDALPASSTPSRDYA